MSLKKLEVHHATKRIHGNTVLQDISCTFLSGKIYGLKGINGSGKTMFMRLLCGLIRPSEGEIFYDERSWGQIFVFRQALESFWKILLFWIPIRGCKI